MYTIYTAWPLNILPYLETCVCFILNDNDNNIESNIDISDTNSLSDINRYVFKQFSERKLENLKFTPEFDFINRKEMKIPIGE